MVNLIKDLLFIKRKWVWRNKFFFFIIISVYWLLIEILKFFIMSFISHYHCVLLSGITDKRWLNISILIFYYAQRIILQVKSIRLLMWLIKNLIIKIILIVWFNFRLINCMGSLNCFRQIKLHLLFRQRKLWLIIVFYMSNRLFFELIINIDFGFFIYEFSHGWQ